MEFEVTASRKRPQSLIELSGQDFVVATLKNSIENSRIAHAYLFSGPRGVGKTSSARILARSLNCEEGPTITPCGVCPNCQEIARGNSLDVIEIDGASNTSVNDIREIKDEVLFSPNSSRYKIYIIDEVHMLSNSAFNALLKTIEEPPPYIIFIFATTEIHKVPATIRSRCQQFNFRLIDLSEIKRLLEAVCGEMSIRFEDDALFWIARESTGSVRDAYTLFDQIVSFAEGHITLDKIREKLGLIGLDQLNDLMTLLVDEKTDQALDLLDNIISGGVSVEQFIVDLAEYFRNILFIFHGVKKESLIGYTPDRFATAVLENLNPVQIEWALDEILQLFRDIRYSVNPRFELELLISRLSSIRYHIDPKNLIHQLNQMKEQLTRGTPSVPVLSAGEEQKKKSLKPAETTMSDALDRIIQGKKEDGGPADAVQNIPPEVTPPKDPVEAPAESPADSSVNSRSEELPDLPIGELREKILGAVRKNKLSLSAALEKSAKWERSGDSIILYYEDSFACSMIEKESRDIEKMIGEALGWHTELKSRIIKKEETREVIVEEQVELVRNVFRGTIVKGKR